MRKTIKQYLRKTIYTAFPSAQKMWICLNMKARFVGWDMMTRAELPWNDRHCPDIKAFNRDREDIKACFEFGPDIGLSVDTIDGLLWRHYIVSCAVRYASVSADPEAFNMIEAGVADGITAFFSLRAAREKRRNQPVTMHLYDSWGAMRKEELLCSETGYIGNYGQLNIERAKKNLAEFSDHLIYHPGYLPETLSLLPAPPTSVHYMHIDLNSALPTLRMLEFFWPHMPRGGVILFDDYGWMGYEDTKNIIDEFFAGRDGLLLKLPTGQALYFR